MSSNQPSMRFGVIAEIHRADPGTPRVSWHNELLLDRTDELLDLAIDRIHAERVDSLVLLGDLTNVADSASYQVVSKKAAAFHRPVLALPGNHDIDQSDALARFTEHLSTPEISVAPATITDHPGLVLISLAIGRDAQTNSLVSHGFPELRDFAGKALLIFSHYPLLAMQPRLHQAGLKHAGDLMDRQRVAERLFEHDGPVVIVHGHLHVRAAAAECNVLHLSCAALVEPPHELTFVSIDGESDGPTVRFEAAAVMTSSTSNLPVLDPANQEWQFVNGQWSRAYERS